MSDEAKTEQEGTEESAANAALQKGADKSGKLFEPTATPSTPKAPPGMLTRGTDLAARPGFRSAANNKSKAQKKRK